MVTEELVGEVGDVEEAGDVGAVEAVVEAVEVVVSTYTPISSPLLYILTI